MRHRSHGSSCKAKWPNSSSSCRAAGHCSCFLQAARADRDRWDMMGQNAMCWATVFSVLQNAKHFECAEVNLWQVPSTANVNRPNSWVPESFPFRSWTFHYFPSPSVMMKCCCHWIILLCTLPAVAAFASSCRADFWALRKDLIEKGNNNSNRKKSERYSEYHQLFHGISKVCVFISFPIHFLSCPSFPTTASFVWRGTEGQLANPGSWSPKITTTGQQFQSMQEFGTTCYNCLMFNMLQLIVKKIRTKLGFRDRIDMKFTINWLQV